jgi:hypothetical protein
MLSSHTRFELGNSSKIRFWSDMWYGKKALKKAFPDIYSVAYVDASVAVDLELFSSSLQWNVNFIKAAHDWEMDVLLCSSICCSFRVRQEGED